MTRTAVTLLLVAALAVAGCTSSGARFHSVENESGTFDADFTGDGGSTTKSFTWNNPSSRAEVSMDITAASGGSVTVEISDADGTVVGTYTLDDGSNDDTLDGTTQAGTSGDWTIKVTLSDFAGDGSIHVGTVD